MTVNDQQMRAIAFLAASVRPHGARRWDEAGIVASLAKVRHLSLGDVVLAAIRAAQQHDAQTPGVITIMSSPCWRERQGQVGAAPLEPFDHERFCDVCSIPEERHVKADHPFVSVLDHTRKLAATAEADAKRKADALDYARQALGDAKAERAPTPEPVRVINEHVERLRAAKTTTEESS